LEVRPYPTGAGFLYIANSKIPDKMKKKLKFNSGQGFSYASENGVFEVKATIDKSLPSY